MRLYAAAIGCRCICIQSSQPNDINYPKFLSSHVISGGSNNKNKGGSHSNFKVKSTRERRRNMFVVHCAVENRIFFLLNSRRAQAHTKQSKRNETGRSLCLATVATCMCVESIALLFTYRQSNVSIILEFSIK